MSSFSWRQTEKKKKKKTEYKYMEVASVNARRGVFCPLVKVVICPLINFCYVKNVKKKGKYYLQLKKGNNITLLTSFHGMLLF